MKNPPHPGELIRDSLAGSIRTRKCNDWTGKPKCARRPYCNLKAGDHMRELSLIPAVPGPAR
jgi:hypothetical protein